MLKCLNLSTWLANVNDALSLRIWYIDDVTKRAISSIVRPIEAVNHDVAKDTPHEYLALTSPRLAVVLDTASSISKQCLTCTRSSWLRAAATLRHMPYYSVDMLPSVTLKKACRHLNSPLTSFGHASGQSPNSCTAQRHHHLLYQ